MRTASHDTDLPIACTLTPDGMNARLALIDDLTGDGVLERVATSSGVRVRLRDTPAIEQRTRALIAAESKCCAFLSFALQRDGDGLLLDVSGPAEARPVIDMFFASGPARP